MTHFIFDIGSVLLEYYPEQLASEMAQKTGINPDLLYPWFLPERLLEVETGQISDEVFFTKNIQPLLKGWSFEQWIQAYADHYLINSPGMKLLMDLKTRGEKVYLLSNLAEFHKTAIEMKYPEFFTLTESNFLSYELGLHKPDLAIYQKVCELLGTRPEKCVFLDDMEKNIEAARKIGMIGFHFTEENLSQIEEDIVSFIS